MRKLAFVINSRIIQNQFFSGSLVMLVGVNVYNLGQFILHIMVGRILGKAYYGDFASLINILGVFALFQQSLGLTIIKFISSEREERNVAGIIRWALGWSALFGILVAGLIILFAQNISGFLHIAQSEAVYVVAPMVLVGTLVTIGRSVLQGLLKFGWFVISMLSEIGSKLFLAYLFLVSGLAVVGTLTAVLLAVIFSLFIVLFSLKKYVAKLPAIMLSAAPLVKYSISTFLQGLALTSMYTTDLFLVKHFFSPTDAGLYAALAKLGSIVFFAASPVTSVMFPLVSKKHSHGEKYHNIFYLTLLFVGGVASLLVVLYVIFPTFFLFLMGTSFIDGAGILWWFGTFMGLLSVALVFIQFYLSIGKTWVVWLFLVCAALQAVLIYFLHNNLLQVIQMSLMAVSLLVIALFVYFPYHHRR